LSSQLKSKHPAFTELVHRSKTLAPFGVLLQAQRPDGPPEKLTLDQWKNVSTQRWDGKLIECNISCTPLGLVKVAHLAISVAHRMQIDNTAAKLGNKHQRYASYAQELDSIFEDQRFFFYRGSGKQRTMHRPALITASAFDKLLKINTPDEVEPPTGDGDDEPPPSDGADDDRDWDVITHFLTSDPGRSRPGRPAGRPQQCAQRSAVRNAAAAAAAIGATTSSHAGAQAALAPCGLGGFQRESASDSRAAPVWIQ
jgi:hypothetical protein